MLTVICPIYNEEKYIAKCIESIMRQDYPKDDMEVLFVDGMSTDKTREIIAGYLPQCPYLRVLDNPHKIVPYAMNKGISEAKGDIIMRVDAHTYYEPNYCSAIVKRLQELDAENCGSVCKTDVLNKTPKTLAIREVLSNKFGVGNSAFRTGIDGVKEVDTVPFGCWPRRVFDKYGLYNTKLVRNQDIELSKRIINGGGKIVIIPDTYCTYMARETFAGLAKNNYGNGKWNILTVYYTHNMKSLSVRHFIPLLFVLGLLVPTLVGLFWHPAFIMSVFVAALYLMVIGSVSLKLSVSKKLSFCYLLWSFITLHVSYGWGALMGIMAILCERVALAFKWLFDRFASLIGLLVLWPVLVVVAVLIKLQMPGPVFFKQKRVGKNGKIFTMVKFRSMTVDHGGSSVSVAGESRITPLGAKLRKYKLDELPELWNVLKGDMSFVGPRPDVPGYADALEGEDREILSLRPGITGPASLKYRDEEDLIADFVTRHKVNAC